MTFDPQLERVPLSELERSWLSELEPGRTSEPPCLSSRHVADMTVSGLVFRDSWAQTLVERATFVECKFEEHDFSAALLREVTFVRCKLEHCSYDATVFETCRFVECELVESTLKGTALHDCDFVDSDLIGLTMYGVRFDGVRMERGTLAHIRLSECMVHFWHLSATTLDTVRLTLCEAGRVASSGCTIAHLSILGGSYGYVELAGGTLSDLLIASANVDTCQLLDIATSTRVRINQSKLRALSLERCTVSDLYCWSSDLLLVRLAEGACEGSITECTLGAGGRIEDVELRSFFWDGSTVSDLTFARVRFQRFLSARAARFSGLRLEQVSFAPDFELDLEDASFEGGDTFSLPTRDEGAAR